MIKYVNICKVLFFLWILVRLNFLSNIFSCGLLFYLRILKGNYIMYGYLYLRLFVCFIKNVVKELIIGMDYFILDEWFILIYILYYINVKY